MSTAPYNQPVMTLDMIGSERVKPPGIMYGRINPECIATDIRLVRFTPVSTITQAKGNDVIRFLISNDGFFDPFSAYIRIRVECNDLSDDEIRYLDRSAHSFILRSVIRCNGVEIERIENYDVMAAMINDTLYSPEQMKQHHWEGFPAMQMPIPVGFNTQTDEEMMSMAQMNSILSPGAAPWDYLVGEHAFYNELSTDGANTNVAAIASLNDLMKKPIQVDAPELKASTSAYRSGGGRPLGVDKQDYIYHYGMQNGKPGQNVAVGTDGTKKGYILKKNNVREFIIPLYSGFLGVLMPMKKFVPLSFIPLDIEFTLNPHALYSSHSAEEGGKRNYTITKFELFSHILFFDSAVNNELETSIASYGFYLHCNSFQLAPVTITSQNTTTVPAIIQVGMSHKSINSVHLLFYYNLFESTAQARKLHFVSHNLKKLYLRNGTAQIPTDPMIAADAQYGSGDTFNFSHVIYLVETLKSWNKMHDTQNDCLIDVGNWGGDLVGIQGATTMTPPALRKSKMIAKEVLCEIYAKQALVGRTQYGINLEGEELGEDKTLISGRSAKTPFDIWLSGEKAELYGSYSNVFIRYDYIVQVRPDLLLQVSGR